MARELAVETGESLTEAVLNSLRERLERQRGARRQGFMERIRRLQNEVAALPRLDQRTSDEIIGYTEHGVPG